MTSPTMHTMPIHRKHLRILVMLASLHLPTLYGAEGIATSTDDADLLLALLASATQKIESYDVWMTVRMQYIGKEPEKTDPSTSVVVPHRERSSSSSSYWTPT